MITVACCQVGEGLPLKIRATFGGGWGEGVWRGHCRMKVQSAKLSLCGIQGRHSATDVGDEDESPEALPCC